MVSKLLNIFRRIDATRITLINSLLSKKYDVSRDATLNEISQIVETHMPECVNDNPATNSAYDNIVYYDNPEDDPEVWKVPNDWPDIETILKNEDVIVNPDDPSVTYKPIAIYLLKATDLDNNTINLSTTASLSVSPWYTRSTTVTASHIRFNYNLKRCVKNNEGTVVFMEQSTSNTYEMTWDPSKDIVINDVHYRYIIEFIRISTHTYYYGTLAVGTIPMDIIAAVKYLQLGGALEYNAPMYGKAICNTLQYIKYIDLNDASFKSEISETLLKHCPGNSMVGFTQLYRIEIMLNPETVLDKNNSNNASGFLMSQQTTAFICNSKEAITKLRSVGIPVGCGLIYYKAPVLFPALCTYNVEDAGGLKYIYEVPRLKYIDIDEEQQKNSTYMVYGANDNHAYATQGVTTARAGYPYINNITPFIYGTTYDGNLNFLSHKINHLKLKGATLSTIQHTYVDTIELLTMSTLSISSSSKPGSEVRCRTLIMDSLTSIDIKGNGEFNHVQNIIAPNLTDITCSGATTGYTIIGPNVRTLYCPSLVNIKGNPWFLSAEYSGARCYQLINLTLGNGFKSKLSLQYCYNLSKESMLDLFNKLAPLTEEEIASGTYNIRFPIKGPAKIDNFTAEELAIMTDKGWGTF